jgi:hypothetical protein
MEVCGQRQASAALYPWVKDPVPIGHEAGWAPEPVWTQRIEKKSFVSSGDRTPVSQSVYLSRCYDSQTEASIADL